METLSGIGLLDRVDIVPEKPLQLEFRGDGGNLPPIRPPRDGGEFLDPNMDPRRIVQGIIRPVTVDMQVVRLQDLQHGQF